MRPVSRLLPLALLLAGCNVAPDAPGPSRLLAPPDAVGNASIAANSIVRTYNNWVITLTDIGALTATGQSSAYSINDLGEILGTATDAAGHQARPIWINGVIADSLRGTAGTPYRWNNRRETTGFNVVNSKISCPVYWLYGVGSGQYPTLPGGVSCQAGAYDVNASGEMAGYSRTTSPTIQTRPVTFRGGAIVRDLGMPPRARTAIGRGINDAGDVVGELTDSATGAQVAFLYRNGTYTRLTPLPGPYGTLAIDINNRGDILGQSNGGNYVVWLAGNSTPTALPMMGRYIYSLAQINDNGDVIGSVSAAPGSGAFYTAALWRNLEFIDLGAWPSGSESYARGINNAGTIVGVSNVPGGVYGLHAVTWTVVPKGGNPINTPPQVTIAATTATTIRVGGSVTMRATFTDPDAGDAPWSYSWRWGNGPTSGTWPSPGSYTATRSYTRAGTYNVRVIVTDLRGAADTSNTVTVRVQ